MIEKILDVATKDGAMETFVCHPERGGPYPPVLFLMDAPGIREELYDMARRLATDEGTRTRRYDTISLTTRIRGVADAVSALSNLGYSSAQASAALARVVSREGDGIATEKLIRLGLRELSS